MKTMKPVSSGQESVISLQEAERRGGWADANLQSGRGLPHSKTLRVEERCRIVRQLLDCASPLALSNAAGAMPIQLPSGTRFNLSTLLTVLTFQRATVSRSPAHRLTHFLALTVLFLAQAATHALISEPDNRLWGSITLGTNVVSASQTNIVVEARRSLSGPPLASYRMGENPKAGSFYSLAIPLESGNPITDPNATRTGETILVLVHNGEFIRYLTLYTVGGRGQIVRVDMGDIDADNNGLVDNWERQFFQRAGQDPNGDPDRDGVSNRNEMLGGTNPTVPDSRHPADTNPTNNVVSIGEVTAYALAWKTGKSWPVAPTNIPVEFVARAGFLWKNGEKYMLNTNNLAAGAPLWWTNLPPASPNPGLLGANTPGRVATKSRIAPASQATSELNPSGGVITRSISASASAIPAGGSPAGAGESPALPSEQRTVTLEVKPSDQVSAYVVEEILPEGWTPGAISGDGQFDTASRKLRWGVFFDHQERTLRYELRAASESDAGNATLAGQASFDGWNAEITGVSTIRRSTGPQLHAPVLGRDGLLSFRMEGEAGRRYEIQVSDDLINWAAESTVTAGADGQLEFTQKVQHADRQRFYRARKLTE